MNILFQVSLEDFLESCRAPALLTELEDDDEADDALDSDKENEPTYQEVVSIPMTFYFCFSTCPVTRLWYFEDAVREVYTLRMKKYVGGTVTRQETSLAMQY